MPDERFGQVGRAFVVTKRPVAEDDLIARSRDRMAVYKIALNATGKVMKPPDAVRRSRAGYRAHATRRKDAA